MRVSLAKQTADARVGGSLLVLGFADQFLGTVVWDPEWANYWITLTLAASVPALRLAMLVVTRARNVRRAEGESA